MVLDFGYCLSCLFLSWEPQVNVSIQQFLWCYSCDDVPDSRHICNLHRTVWTDGRVPMVSTTFLGTDASFLKLNKESNWQCPSTSCWFNHSWIGAESPDTLWLLRSPETKTTDIVCWTILSTFQFYRKNECHVDVEEPISREYELLM